MNIRSSDYISAVADIIQHEVLPELEPSNWTASRLRSSLFILRYLEQRVPKEHQMLLDENCALAEVLGETREALSKCDDTTASMMQERLQAADDLDAYAANESYQELADLALNALHNKRDAMGDSEYFQARERLVASLIESQQRIAPLVPDSHVYSTL